MYDIDEYNRVTAILSDEAKARTFHLDIGRRSIEDQLYLDATCEYMFHIDTNVFSPNAVKVWDFEDYRFNYPKVD